MLAALPLSTALARRSAVDCPIAQCGDGGEHRFADDRDWDRLLFSTQNRSDYCLVMAALICIGAGIGIFTPANQTLAFAAVKRENYGVLAAMLSSFGTAARHDRHNDCRGFDGSRRRAKVLDSTRRICRRATIWVCLPGADWDSSFDRRRQKPARKTIGRVTTLDR